MSLREDAGELVLSISDNGQGFEMAHAQNKGGHGLRNMRERAAAIGGVLHVDHGEEDINRREAGVLVIGAITASSAPG